MAVPSLLPAGDLTLPALVGGTATLLVSLDAAPGEANGEQRTDAGNAREEVLGVGGAKTENIEETS
ncbi:hypothetical protein EYB53_001510 [Candidatus Chloroploca sp. M-50]|uniref:Secreted protein n=1 Tax=Candidatus Chloroploca mongolica TaxID=2528176 RepID=A0ABS4D4N3_9CHLR|nr:hypothetical protein [Candidatus Chloroploca mongolica]MBP1464373.1 hypothetical protein [Candidatus Chloroploca mongolica]